VRASDALAERLDTAIPYVAADPGIRAAGAKVTRSTVARVAMEIGLRVLEERRAAGLPPVEAPTKP
jgi:hypothetical protein